jgi:deazaflavin-dependent oxidoreductase (nitroreductase family)
MKGHTLLFRMTGGRIGGSLNGLPMLLLHHVGAKSGQHRVAPLLYMPEGEQLVLVASKGGYPKNPGWFHNLKANPDTVVELPKEGKVPVRASVATAEQRAELWPKVVDLYKGYADYQASTDREIPLVILNRR